MLMSTLTFAGQSNQALQLKSLGSAFKPHNIIAPKIDPKDITMGYTGQDLAAKPSLS
jgi:hypothetical protein